MSGLDLEAKSVTLRVGGGKGDGAPVAKVGIDTIVRQSCAEISHGRAQSGSEVAFPRGTD